MLNCSKEYRDIPFAHRLPNHQGHCFKLHGHNWSFKVVFVAAALDGSGFIIDFGDLGFIKRFIDQHLDHALVLQHDDPLLGAATPLAKQLEELGLAKFFYVPDATTEGLARYFRKVFDDMTVKHTDARVRVFAVEVKEDSKNTAMSASNEIGKYLPSYAD